jgi:two-component system response regulator AlgR
MNVLIVDDEPLARSRLRRLLAELPETAQAIVDEAADAAEAWVLLRAQRFDVLLLDIQMPGQTGMELARRLTGDPGLHHPAIVFVTAHEQHALDAFGVSAVDYLTKPVRRERLAQAMGKAVLWLRAQGAKQQAPAAVETVYLTVQHHGALKRVPLADILYCRAEAKYTTLRTAERQYLVDLSLTDLEQRYAEHLVRIHRSALVAAPAIRSLERPISPPDGIAPEPEAGSTETGSTENESGAWTLHLHGVPDTLPVSRRRVAAVQALLTASRPAAARQATK